MFMGIPREISSFPNSMYQLGGCCFGFCLEKNASLGVDQVKFLISFLLCIAAVFIVNGQTTKSEKQFLPAEHIDSFQKALSRFSDCNKRHDWGCVYDLTYRPTLEKAEFIAKKTDNFYYDMESLKDLNLILTGKYTDQKEGVEAWYSIQGCLKFSKRKAKRAETQAYLVNGEWLFGRFWSWANPRGVKERPCKMDAYTRESDMENNN